MASELLLADSGVVQTEDGAYYSATAIAEMRIVGLPKSRAGVYKRAERDGWKVIHQPGRGAREGVRYFKLPDGFIVADEAHTASATKPEVKTATERLGQYVKYEDLAATATPLKPSGDFVYIDKYVNVKGAAGAGQDVHDEAIVQVRLDARLLRERIGNNIGRIKIASVSGDSMEPTLSHGDQVLVDTSIDRFVENAIYAIQQDGHLRFKRIKLKLDGSIIVKSDNPLYNEPETYTAEEAQYFKVIGVVIPFKFGRFKL